MSVAATLAAAALVRTYRQSGCVRIPKAIPHEVVTRLRDLYHTASIARGHAPFPAPFDKALGPFVDVAVIGADPTLPHNAQTQAGRAVTVPMSAPHSLIQPPPPQPDLTRPQSTFYIKCRSPRHRRYLLRKAEKKFGLLTAEQAKAQWSEDVRWMQTQAFDDMVRKKYWFYEYQAFLKRMGTHRYNLFTSSPNIRGALYDDGAAVLPFDVVAQLTGCLGLRLWCEDYFTKEAFSNAVPLHCFLPFVGLCNASGDVEARGASVWVLLDDWKDGEAGMCFVESSHEVMRRKYGVSAEDLKNPETLPISFDFGMWRNFYTDLHGSRVVPLEGKAGDVIVINHATLHGLASNMGAKPWSALCYHVVPEGSVYAGVRNSFVSRHLIGDTIGPGHVLSSEVHFPVLHTE